MNNKFAEEQEVQKNFNDCYTLIDNYIQLVKSGNNDSLDMEIIGKLSKAKELIQKLEQEFLKVLNNFDLNKYNHIAIDIANRKADLLLRYESKKNIIAQKKFI